MNTKTIGNKTEAKVLAALVEVYPAVLLPFGDNERYDFVVEDFDGSFLKIQAKTAHYKNGVIIFNGYSTTRINGIHTTTPYKKGEVDYYAVFCPDLSDVWLVPFEDGTAGKVQLRVDPYKGRQQYKCKWAIDYVLR